MLPQVEISLGNWVQRPVVGDEEPEWVCAVVAVTPSGIRTGWAIVRPDVDGRWWWALVDVEDNGRGRIVVEGEARSRAGAMRAAKRAAVPEWKRLAKAGAL